LTERRVAIEASLAMCASLSLGNKSSLLTLVGCAMHSVWSTRQHKDDRESVCRLIRVIVGTVVRRGEPSESAAALPSRASAGILKRQADWVFARPPIAG